MNMFSQEQCKLLLEQHGEPCISLYLPTHPREAHIPHDRSRLQQQIRQAENLLFLAHVPAEQGQTLLEPMRALLEEEAFWLQASQGLALFRCPDVFTCCWLPDRCQERVVLSSHFYLKPLLPWLSPGSKAQQEAAARYRDAAASGRASTDVRQVLAAAYDGRVESLWVSSDQEQWGTFDPVSRTLHVHRMARFTDEDVLDLAATQTLQQGGAVYALEREYLPERALIAAVFRHDPPSQVEENEQVTRGDTSRLAGSQAQRSKN